MFYMASDRIFKNVAHKWAYISVSGARDNKTDRHLEDVGAFIQELYPHMAINE